MPTSEARRKYLTRKKRESRDRARAEGKCIVCTRNAAESPLVTCAECRSEIVEWQRQNGWPRKTKPLDEILAKLSPEAQSEAQERANHIIDTLKR